MRVELVKIGSGEEFIAEIISVVDNLSCKNMVKLMPTQQGLAMVPFNPLIDEDTVVTFNLNHVTFVSPINEKFVDEYKRAFSGLALPPKKSLIL